MSFGNAKPASTTTAINYTPDQKSVLATANPVIKDYVAGGGAKMPDFSTVAPFSANQQWAQQEAMRRATGDLSSLSDMYKGNAAFLGGDALNPDSNPFLRDAAAGATRPLYENLMEKVLPTVRGEAVMNGMFGGSAQGIAEAGAIKDTQRQVADTTSSMYSGAYNTGMDRMLSMLGMGKEIAQGVMAPTQVANAVGGEQQAQSQQQLQEQYMRHMYEQMAPFLAAREGIGATMQQGTGTTTTGTAATPSTGQQVLGGFATLAGLFL